MAANMMMQAPPVLSPMSPSPLQGAGGFSNASLYVGDLHHSVTEQQLFDLFGQIGAVLSVRVCRDQIRRVSLGYGYVNYTTAQEAIRALEMLNYTVLNGKPIRIMFSHRDPSMRKSGYANIFIKNLHPGIDNKNLHETFVSFGTIISCKVATDSDGQSKGFAFVQFDREEAACNAISKLNGKLLNNKPVYVGLFVRRQERNRANGSPKFKNVYIKNLPETFTDDNLKEEFVPFGPITSAVIARDENGYSRGFGFVSFKEEDSASAAVEQLNGKTIDEKVIYVGRAQKKAEREAELRAKFEQERKGRMEKLQGANLYLKNLDDSFNNEKLKEMFSPFGEIISCRVMLDEHGQSRGSGFVQFTSPDEANRAITEMNGKMMGRKPLYVAIAERKEERRARLQAYFSQINSPGPITPIPSVAAYHPGPHRLAAPQVYYGQGASGLVPQQPAGFGFQQQLIPGFQPGVDPNFMMPFHLQGQGQPGQRMGVRRGGMAHQMQRQQLAPRNANQGFRYMQNLRNGGVEPAMVHQGLMGPMIPMPLNAGSMQVTPMDTPRAPSIPISALASALASATPEKQRPMLGEQLYPLVQQIEQLNAGKVTGMLLEMDQTEVLHLIESPDALQKKVGEAMEVLRSSVHATGSAAAD